MTYDHRIEVDELRERARAIRGRAAALRDEASQLDAYAERIDVQADCIHRLCTRGATPPATCCKNPGVDLKLIEEYRKLTRAMPAKRKDESTYTLKRALEDRVPDLMKTRLEALARGQRPPPEAACCPFHAMGGHPDDRHGFDPASVVYGAADAPRDTQEPCP